MTTKKGNKVKAPLSLKTSIKKVSGKEKTSPKPNKVPVKKLQPLKSAPIPSKKTVKKPLPPKKALKKVSPKAKPVKKARVASAAPKKDLVKKTVNKAPTHLQKATHKIPTKTVPAPESKKTRFLKGDLDQFKNELLNMRDRITGQSGAMRNAALQRNDEINPEEDGTDAFMRLQTLEQVSSQHQIIANIDEALRSIEKGAYGVCDSCGELISKPRLAVLPFATNCIKCQSEMERVPRPGGRR